MATQNKSIIHSKGGPVPIKYLIGKDLSDIKNKIPVMTPQKKTDRETDGG